MTLTEQQNKLQGWIGKGAAQLKKETGIEFRTAFKQRKGRISYVIMPSDLIRKNI